MIRGMSYYKGIFFMNHKGISHATIKNSEIITQYFPLSARGFFFLLTRLIFSIPIYFVILGFILIVLIERPSMIFSNLPFARYIPEIPLYMYILFLFSYHFMFPLQLKKYHGAEHKVFSYKGKRHLAHAAEIQMADIVNRYCSTNTVVLFFCFFFLSIPFVNGWIATTIGFMATFLIPRFWKWGDRSLFFPISAYLQKKITTSKPEQNHLKVAILSYMSLQAERALNEKEVWQQYEQELEVKRIAEAERKRNEEVMRINRWIEEEERKHILFDHYRDSLIMNYIASMESKTIIHDHDQKIKNIV